MFQIGLTILFAVFTIGYIFFSAATEFSEAPKAESRPEAAEAEARAEVDITTDAA